LKIQTNTAKLAMTSDLSNLTSSLTGAKVWLEIFPEINV